MNLAPTLWTDLNRGAVGATLVAIGRFGMVKTLDRNPLDVIARLESGALAFRPRKRTWSTRRFPVVAAQRQRFRH
jgi:hypothetical protein